MKPHYQEVIAKPGIQANLFAIWEGKKSENGRPLLAR
jgi:hypothetical protein